MTTNSTKLWYDQKFQEAAERSNRRLETIKDMLEVADTLADLVNRELTKFTSLVIEDDIGDLRYHIEKATINLRRLAITVNENKGPNQ